MEYLTMTHSTLPKGSEREVRSLSSTQIDGAPIAYIIVMAAVVTALSFIPFSLIVGSGGSFPLSQGVLGLVGWVLGPLAGGIASGVGALLGVFLAPHTAGPIPLMRIVTSVYASFAAGTMVVGQKRRNWWMPVAAVAVLALAYLGWRAIFLNGVGAWVVLAVTFVNWSAILLFVLPTRKWIAGWLRSPKLPRVMAGLALGTWMIYGITHVIQAATIYHLQNYPAEVWVTLIPVIPFENLVRAAVGVVIGSGVIAGLRAIGLVKPEHAGF
jgi:hypothetical protein